MKKNKFIVKSNRLLAKYTYEMELKGDISSIKRPGQFIHIELDGFFLRRPISICDWTASSLTIVYKAVGRGTEYMARLAEGAELEALVGLGNGFDTQKSGEKPLLIGGGAGIPPLYALTRKLLENGKKVTVVLGFNSADEAFYISKFTTLGANVIITTADGSLGVRGLVTDAMDGLDYSYTYACGPEPMLKAVYDKALTDGQYSFEERMGCGIGVCMGCVYRSKTGYKRICKDGPVLEKEEILWQT